MKMLIPQGGKAALLFQKNVVIQQRWQESVVEEKILDLVHNRASQMNGRGPTPTLFPNSTGKTPVLSCFGGGNATLTGVSPVKS
ncbi:hypothetical protein [Paenibacillus marchantiophytorum]|uniref:hypothetical protein n=1 Tax=Paenibacillus marchantiophytorum TaxID=1619310 RepID=UPI00166D4F0D|nr:hypothetical protein [Paenibacillus marchantiophytorum]